MPDRDGGYVPLPVPHGRRRSEADHHDPCVDSGGAWRTDFTSRVMTLNAEGIRCPRASRSPKYHNTPCQKISYIDDHIDIIKMEFYTVKLSLYVRIVNNVPLLAQHSSVTVGHFLCINNRFWCNQRWNCKIKINYYTCVSQLQLRYRRKLILLPHVVKL